MFKKILTASPIALAFALPMTAQAAHHEKPAPITTEEVEAAQKQWGEGIVAISKTFADKGDYVARAKSHIDTHYAYGKSTVLFKPTLAAADQFRGTYDEALSYFVKGSNPEDTGFAISGWTNVRWENEGIITDGDDAKAMGNYYFTGPDGKETKVEYTFGYMRGPDGRLLINVHHSSVPYAVK